MDEHGALPGEARPAREASTAHLLITRRLGGNGLSQAARTPFCCSYPKARMLPAHPPVCLACGGALGLQLCWRRRWRRCGNLTSSRRRVCRPGLHRGWWWCQGRLLLLLGGPVEVRRDGQRTGRLAPGRARRARPCGGGRVWQSGAEVLVGCCTRRTAPCWLAHASAQGRAGQGGARRAPAAALG